MDLRPCPYRHVGEEGHILCDKIKTGDRQVTPNICRACPISQINCAHLRAKLDHQAHPPIVVRWGNGRTQVWEDHAPSISFSQAACAEKVIPIHSPKDCANCPIRQPLITAQAIARPDEKISIQTQRAPQRPAPAPRPVVQPLMAQATPPPVAPQPAPSPDARSSIVAQKIIQLQEWLARQKTSPATESENGVRPIAASQRPTPRAVGEERRTGWTD